MNLRLLGVALVLPLLLNSCALLQLPANLINGVTAPLRRADNEHAPPESASSLPRRYPAKGHPMLTPFY